MERGTVAPDVEPARPPPDRQIQPISFRLVANLDIQPDRQ